MSASAEIALRQSLHATLSADPNVAGLLGGAHIFDEALDTAKLPYVSFDDAQTRDWSSNTSSGTEHNLGLSIHTDGRGVLEALQVAAAIRECLENATLSLAGHHLILLRQVGLTTRRRKRGRIISATIKFKALTEAQ